MLAPRYQAHELPYEVIVRLPILFTRTLRSQSVNFDHRILWSWIGQLLVSKRFVGTKINTLLDDDEFVTNFLLLVRIELASLWSPPVNEEVRKLNGIIDQVISYHVKEMVMNKDSIGLAFSFPVLERCLKILCYRYLNTDGTVRERFNVLGLNRVYETGERVSSLKVLILLFKDKVATGEMKKSLDNFSLELQSIFPRKGSMVDMLYSWRNGALHGDKMYSKYHAVIMNFISMLILDAISQIYPKLSEAATHRMKNALIGIDSPWDVYPPKLF